METLLQRYQRLLQTPSDLQPHLPVLHELATGCKHVIDLGAGQGIAATAFALAEPETLTCVDLKIYQELLDLKTILHAEGPPPAPPPATAMDIQQEDSRQIMFEDVDLLFIDTTPSYAHLLEELIQHAPSVNSFIVIPGTTRYATEGHFRDDPAAPGEDLDLGVGELVKCEGLAGAIKEYFDHEPGWEIQHESTEGSGLLVMRRI